MISLLTSKMLFYFDMDVGVGVDVDVGVGVGGGIFLPLNLLIIIWYIVYVSMFISTKGIVVQQKSYGF